MTLPDEFIPAGQKTVGKEPDAPLAGWANGTSLPTDADICPHCDELVEYVNQHSGYETDGRRWHRRCWLLSQGFVETDSDKDRRYHCDCQIDAPDTVIRADIWAGTFVMGDWRYSWTAEQTPTERDRQYLQSLTDGDDVEARLADVLLNQVDIEGGSDD